MSNPSQDPSPASPASQALTHTDPPAPPTTATKGQRIAGGLLLVNAALVLAELAILRDEAAAPGLSRSPTSGIVPIAIDIWMGISLLSGNRKLVPWAIVRAVLGAAIYTVLRLSTEPVTAVFPVLVGAALLLLLIGEASRARMGAGASAFGLYVLLEIAGLASALTGTNYLARWVMTASGDIEPGAAGRVQGIVYPYTINTPGSAWYLRKDEVAKKNNPLADRWLVRPDKDAHVLIIMERQPGLLLLIEDYADAVLANIKRASTKCEDLGRATLRGYPENGLLLHTRCTMGRLDIESYYGVIAAGDRGFQIAAFTSTEAFPGLSVELMQIIDSFELPPEALDPVIPKDVEEAPAGRVVGVSYGYSVQAPSSAWHLRKAEFAKKDNELVDRWLVRPDKEAHVLVLAEHMPGLVLSIDLFADEVVKNAQKTSTRFALDAREPLETNPASGRLLSVTATVNGLDITSRYGLVTAGDRAFQIIAFTKTSRFPSVEADIMKIIGSFTLPKAP